ncbi:hypothetical protein CP975_34525 [Streptomyces alboniger]|uniref:Uncharacterized protein n=1 Tax=Streptomyces alboniger TaxID=132473 RepID=A0A5J6HUF9_STRAD|nr:hypothetical protein CP975_34525 [Streptomyces alboniger]
MRGHEKATGDSGTLAYLDPKSGPAPHARGSTLVDMQVNYGLELISSTFRVSTITPIQVE